MERLATGIEGLDDMLHGGLLPETAVLVRGAPGVGKTTLGLSYLIHGAQQGQPGLFITFEEFPETLYRDANNLGWDLRDMEEQGVLQTMFTSPQVLLASLEDPLSPLSEMLRTQGIKRLVLDSITHFQKLAVDSEALRALYNQLVNAFKRERITAILLSEASQMTTLMQDEVGHLLFVVDGVILLGYVESDSLMHRGLTILKLRGSDHAKEIRRFQIAPGGLVLGEPFHGTEGILSGSPRARRQAG